MALRDFSDFDPVEGTRERDLEEIIQSLTQEPPDLGGGAVSLPRDIISPPARTDVLGRIADFWRNTPPPAPLENAMSLADRASLKERVSNSALALLPGVEAGAGGGMAPDTSSGIGLLNELARRRIGQLQEEPFTGTQEARRRVAAFDTLERQRQQARRQVVARLADQGHLPSSGTVEAALQMVDRRFDEFRTTTERDLLLESVGIGERRQNLAVTLAQMLAQLQLQQEELAQRERMGTQATQAQQSSGLFEGLGTLLGFILGGPKGILPGLFG